MSFCTFKSAVLVLWHLRYADWNGGFKPCDVKYACVWSKTARSVNFETYCKLDTGLKLVNSESTPDLLGREETNASFQQSGNSPDVKKQTIMRVMTESRTSRQDTTSDVGAGHGSSGQDLSSGQAMPVKPRPLRLVQSQFEHPNDSLQWLMLLFSYMKCFLWNIKCET